MSKRIDEITTTPLTNHIQRDATAWDRYLAWMRQASMEASDRELTSVRFAKEVLGPQDFCWTGWHRNWVWVREFAPGRSWRLFASTRGFTLEFEGGNEPTDENLQAAKDALNHFITTWEAGL